MEFIGTFPGLASGYFAAFQCHSYQFIYFFQAREEISGIIETSGFYGIFQIFPDDLPKPS